VPVAWERGRIVARRAPPRTASVLTGPRGEVLWQRQSVDDALRLGVDLGGTKLEAVVVRVGGDQPQVLARVRAPTGRDEGYEHIVEATAKLIAHVAAQAGLPALPPIGVGMPGSVTSRRADGTPSPVALIKNSNTTCLNGRPFRFDLASAVGRPIAFANDANCFALAEATYGAARDARVAFGVIVGTGVGGGIVFREVGQARVWDGAQGIAGEWGHVVLDPSGGPPCYCGRRGCVEQYLSGPAIERAYQARTGEQRSVPEIAARAAENADARAILDSFVDAYGRALASVINIVDPDAIVLGGGLSNLGVLYEQGPAAVARWIFNDEVRTQIVKNALGDSAGVLGAALLP
jgi:fructokinase